MKNIFKDSLPVFRFFEEISDIPRGSGNEKAIADYIEDFARSRGHYCKRDSLNNVFVRKAASVGRENEPSVLFQAHTDMVCVAKADKEIDFLSEPIELMSDGKYIYANGTSLGADDGSGVALMLALIDENGLDAPETEYLFTVSEETGMDGANGFDYSEVRSGKIINLDSSEELIAYVGCAGGVRADAVISAERVKVEGKICEIEVSGLASGHSGTEIDKNRRSAIKLLAYVLNKIYKGYPFHIAGLSGGTRENVIPLSARATVVFADNVEAKRAREKLTEIKKELLGVLSKEDRKRFCIRFSSVANTSDSSENTVDESELEKIIEGGMLSLKSSSTLISMLMLSPQGVTDRYSGKNGLSGEVAGSVNLGIVRTRKSDTVLSYLIRSANPFFSDKTFEEIERLAHICGGTVVERERYPGWDAKDGESLQGLYAEVCSELYGKRVSFLRVHAGLECGMISEGLKRQGITPEIISIGPNNLDIHTHSERLEIASLQRLYDTVKLMLKRM